MEEKKMSKFLKTIDTKNMGFYRFPKFLFTNRKYKNISIDAKVLYMLLLDRMCLSDKNKLQDEQEEVFLYFTQKEVMKLLGYAHGKVSRLFKELSLAKLIYRDKSGNGRAHRIYMMKSSDFCEQESVEDEEET